MKKLIAVGHWSSTTFGTKADGEVFSASDDFAESLVNRGYAKEYSIKPHNVRPAAPAPAESQLEPKAKVAKRKVKTKSK